MTHQKILVTGGTGFIGSHTVVELATAGFVPVLIDNFNNSKPSVLGSLEKLLGKKPSFHQGDCCDETFLRSVFEKEGKIDGVIHFAAHKAVFESVENPIKYYRNNLESLLSLLNVMEETKTTNLIFSSSCTVYGQPEKLPVTESSPILPAQSPYGHTKQICEEMLAQWILSKKQLKYIALRYFNPVGAHPSSLIGELPTGLAPNNLVPYVTQTAAGIRDKLSIFGNDYETPDGTCIRDFIHVVDLAIAHVKAFELLNTKKETSYGDHFNIGTGKGNSVLEIITAFEKINHVKVPHVFAPRRQGDIMQIYASCDKAKKVLKWEAKKTLEESVRDAWNWQKTLQ